MRTARPNSVYFARLADLPNLYAAMCYDHPTKPGVQIDMPDQGFKAVWSKDPDLHNKLPALTWSQAHTVAWHSFYSGADIVRCARIYAEQGFDAMFDYCDAIAAPDGEQLSSQNETDAEGQAS